MANIVLKIDGMTCNGCAGNVKRVLSAMPGVSEVTVDFSAGEAHIQFEDGETPPQALINAVEEVGFEAFLPLPPA